MVLKMTETETETETDNANTITPVPAVTPVISTGTWNYGYYMYSGGTYIPVTVTYSTAASPISLWTGNGPIWVGQYQPQPQPQPRRPQPPPTPEEVEARRQQMRREAEERQQRRWRDIPWESSPDLTPEDCEQLRSQGYLELNSSLHRRRVYRVYARAYSQPEVFTLSLNGVQRRLEGRICVQPTRHDVDMPHWMAIQKMLLLADEERYLASANYFPESSRSTFGHEGARQPAIPFERRYSGLYLAQEGVDEEDVLDALEAEYIG